MIYYGFFDAAFDETTGAYDRTYNSGDFTGYFENFIGSGVCVYNNPNSFKVSVLDKNAIIASGYLFINGYWLKNDSDYVISFAGIGDGVYAVYAKLNLGARLIELGQMTKADSYTDTLVLAYVTIKDGALSVEDTRYNSDICGVIDAVGSLTSKIEYAINYIDTQIESKLQQIEQDLQNQSDIINSKLDEANSLIAKIAPPPVGTVKFSASSTIEDGWLKCDGSFISESQYPELVAALGKLIPSGDKFKLISDGEIGTSITNGVLYDGRMWVYSWSTQKLYGVDVNGEEPIKEIVITCDDIHFSNLQNPNSGRPLALSIVSDFSGGYKIFLCQIIGNVTATSTDTSYMDNSKILFFCGEMQSDLSTIALTRPFSKIDVGDQSKIANINTIPYVISKNVSGSVKFYCLTYSIDYIKSSFDTQGISLVWDNTPQNNATQIEHTRDKGLGFVSPSIADGVFCGYNHKNLDEYLYIEEYTSSSSSSNSAKDIIHSYPDSTFARLGGDTTRYPENLSETPIMCSIAGQSQILVNVELMNNRIITISRNTLTSINEVPLTNISLPTGAKAFQDGSCYLWGKDMFFIFVGTGIIFSRTLEEGSFGYLDTTSVLGQITQGGYIDYSQDEGTLYLIGQDTANKVKVAKIILNTLYDYANDGAWLPLIASDGVPAWIKAIDDRLIVYTFTEIFVATQAASGLPSLNSIFSVTFNGENILGGKNIKLVAKTTVKMTALQDYTNSTGQELEFSITFGLNSGTIPKAVQLIGKVLAVGEKITKGESVEMEIDVKSLYETYDTGFKQTKITLSTKSLTA